MQDAFNSLLQLFFPHYCACCGSDALQQQSSICGRCLHDLPYTRFEQQADNPVERLFAGRIPLRFALSLCYFTKQSIVQHLLHEIKYHHNREAGVHAGKLIGKSLASSPRDLSFDGIVPLPLHRQRQKERGYNQAEILAEGISSILNVPCLPQLVQRTKITNSQTQMSRAERWENMSQGFVAKENLPKGISRLLLIDDVITTGATIEACAAALLAIPGVELAVASFAYALK
jgi:ComF family protein